MTINTRTIEVVYEERQTYDGVVKKWEVLAGGKVLGRYNKKKVAVKNAKEYAKDAAVRKQASMEVKIFKKDGDWSKEHVYEP